MRGLINSAMGLRAATPTASSRNLREDQGLASGRGLAGAREVPRLRRIVRLVKRGGKTKAAAERALRAALVERLAPVKQSIITAQTTIEKVAELWLAEIEQAVNSGSKSPSTLDAYRTIYHRHVRPVLGAPRVREVDTPAVDRYWQQSRSKPSAERGQRRL